MKEKEFNELLQRIENGTFVGNKITIDGEEPFQEGSKSQNALTDDNAIALTNVLKKNPNITILNLPWNNIGNIGATALASVDTIEELNLWGNEIRSEGAIALANSNLKKLNLTSNFIVQDKTFLETMEVIKAFNANKTITNLTLHNCLIPNKAFAQLIKNNNTITTLDINNLDLTDEALEYI